MTEKTEAFYRHEIEKLWGALWHIYWDKSIQKSIMPLMVESNLPHEIFNCRNDVTRDAPEYFEHLDEIWENFTKEEETTDDI